MRGRTTIGSFFAAGCFALCGAIATAQQPADSAVKITVNWIAERKPMKSTPTLQVVVNPLLRRGATIHDKPESSGCRLRSLCAVASVSASCRGGVGAADQRQDIVGLHADRSNRSEEHTSELQSRQYL